MDELHLSLGTGRWRRDGAGATNAVSAVCGGGDPGRNADQSLGACAGRVGIRSGRNGFAAVSVAIKRFERRFIRDHSLRKTVESIGRLLNVETWTLIRPNSPLTLA